MEDHDESKDMPAKRMKQPANREDKSDLYSIAGSINSSNIPVNNKFESEQKRHSNPLFESNANLDSQLKRQARRDIKNIIDLDLKIKVHDNFKGVQSYMIG